MSATPPPAPSGEEIRIRFNPVLAALVLVVGVLLILVGVALGDTLQVVVGGIFVVLGVLNAVGTAAVVAPHEVQVKNPLQITMKRVPITSPADLRLDGKVLRRASDEKKIVNLGWGAARSSDIETLRQAIAASSAA